MAKRVRRVWTRSFLDKVDLKQMPEQERISELERKLKGSELECDIFKKSNKHFFQKRSMIHTFII
jgi:hypothetical protein